MKIGGLVENDNLTLYRIVSIKDKPGVAGAILKLFAERNINLEYITESSTADGKAVMSLCVNSKLVEKFDELLKKNKELSKQAKIVKVEKVCILGIYGPHFREKPLLAAKFCKILGEAGINILGLSSSISSISSVIDCHERKKAKKALFKVFKLP